MVMTAHFVVAIVYPVLGMHIHVCHAKLVTFSMQQSA
jgi:hypothetical protein